MQDDKTLKLLYALSGRLSGRSDCKQVEYVVAIGITDKDILDKYGFNTEDLLDGMNAPADYEQILRFSPARLVFPNNHMRKERDKMSILYHVINRYFGDILQGSDDYGNISVYPDSLSSGVYKYILSVDRRRRKWQRVY